MNTRVLGVSGPMVSAVGVGARTRERLTGSLASLELELADADLAAIEQAVPPGEVAGSRYVAAQMAHRDSEV